MQRQESPPRPGNGAPRQGLPRLLAWLLAKGVEESKTSKPEADQRTRGRFSSCPQLCPQGASPQLPLAAFSIPSLQRLAFVPSHWPLTVTPVNVLTARGVVLPSRPTLLRPSRPHPQRAVSEMQRSHRTVVTSFLQAFYPLRWWRHRFTSCVAGHDNYESFSV